MSCDYFSLHKIFKTDEITVFNPTGIKPKDKSTEPSSSELEKVTVSKINQADSFDDYHRPCRPKDFFGRFDTQKKFWDFVKNVRDGNTDLRVVSFSGSTGLGKSSLVLKLASDCRQKSEYKDNFYISHVDVTSVNQKKANLFVIAAIRKALQEAIDRGFVKLPNHQVSIESLEPPYFSNKSIQLLIENAIKHNILTEENPLQITISFNNERIIVTNNFQPKNNNETVSGIGLTNLAERYKLISGDDIIIQTDNNFFSVSIKILKNENNNN